MTRRAWTDFAATAHVQPALIAADVQQPRRNKNRGTRQAGPLEKDIQKIILEALKLHPMVADIERINIMAGKILRKDGTAGRFIRSMKRGHADLEGLAKDGRKIAIEVKRPQTRNNVSDEQRDYLDMVKSNGGYAGIATSVQDAFQIMDGGRL